MKRRVRNKNFLRKGLSLLDMVIALAMIMVIAAAILPQLKAINDGYIEFEDNMGSDGWAVVINVDAVSDPFPVTQ